MEIDFSKTYYFNNRPVKILREETDNFVFVEAILNIDHDLTGSNFCFECNIGPAKQLHTCDDAQEIIDEVMANIEDKEVFWVAKIYLREKPFEFEANQKLQAQNLALSKQVEDHKKELDRLKNNESFILKSISQLLKSYGQYQGQKLDVFNSLQILKDKRDELRQNIKEGRIATVAGTPITITSDRLLELLRAEITLNYLEAGGVDNWEWYGESMKGDPKKEAFNEFINM